MHPSHSDAALRARGLPDSCPLLSGRSSQLLSAPPDERARPIDDEILRLNDENIGRLRAERAALHDAIQRLLKEVDAASVASARQAAEEAYARDRRARDRRHELDTLRLEIARARRRLRQIDDEQQAVLLRHLPTRAEGLELSHLRQTVERAGRRSSEAGEQAELFEFESGKYRLMLDRVHADMVVRAAEKNRLANLLRTERDEGEEAALLVKRRHAEREQAEKATLAAQAELFKFRKQWKDMLKYYEKKTAELKEAAAVRSRHEEERRKIALEVVGSDESALNQQERRMKRRRASLSFLTKNQLEQANNKIKSLDELFQMLQSATGAQSVGQALERFERTRQTCEQISAQVEELVQHIHETKAEIDGTEEELQNYVYSVPDGNVERQALAAKEEKLAAAEQTQAQLRSKLATLRLHERETREFLHNALKRLAPVRMPASWSHEESPSASAREKGHEWEALVPVVVKKVDRLAQVLLSIHPPGGYASVNVPATWRQSKAAARHEGAERPSSALLWRGSSSVETCEGTTAAPAAAPASDTRPPALGKGRSAGGAGGSSHAGSSDVLPKSLARGGSTLVHSRRTAEDLNSNLRVRPQELERDVAPAEEDDSVVEEEPLRREEIKAEAMRATRAHRRKCLAQLTQRASQRVVKPGTKCQFLDERTILQNSNCNSVCDSATLGARPASANADGRKLLNSSVGGMCTMPGLR
ncbi:hypothetical protein AB1Y20_021093 [Prymnesium parvum]|uniref:Cilia- and flagella-associated protein 157 n=1 Tax=Prymnesium parvum TaxID=97485 RepID=A0AB34JHR3_PRYPA